MQGVGEEVEPGSDEIIQTDLDYPMRNVHQISKSVGLIVISGGDGALEEILPALADYGLPVSALRGSGQAAVALEALVQIFPEWAPSVSRTVTATRHSDRSPLTGSSSSRHQRQPNSSVSIRPRLGGGRKRAS
jgi:hypothetical protein